MSMKIAEYSLNHPTLPDVRVKLFSGAGFWYFEEWRNGEHVRDHYPDVKTERELKHVATKFITDARKAAY